MAIGVSQLSPVRRESGVPKAEGAKAASRRHSQMRSLRLSPTSPSRADRFPEWRLRPHSQDSSGRQVSGHRPDRLWPTPKERKHALPLLCLPAPSVRSVKPSRAPFCLLDGVLPIF